MSEVYEIQIEVVNSGTINFSRTPLTKEEFEKLSWIDAVDFLNMHADTYYCDTRDWNIIKRRPDDKQS